MSTTPEEFVDWRLEIAKGFVGKKIEIACTGEILDTLFFSDDAMPFRNPQVAIASALSAYWEILECAARIFTAAEWKTLAERSPFSDGRYCEYAKMTPIEATTAVEHDYPGDEWNAELLAFKALIPKIAVLSVTEFAALNAILGYIRNLNSDDAMFTMSRKLRALVAD